MRQKIIKCNLVKVAVIALAIKVLFSLSVLFTWPSLFDNLAVILAVVVFSIKMCRSTMKLKEFFIMCFMGVIVVCTCVCIKQYDLLISYITIYLLKNEDFDEYIDLIFRTEVIIIVVQILLAGLLSCLGFYERFWIQTGERVRFNGGMNHPNVLASLILSCMMMYAWKYFGKMDRNKYVNLWMVTFISYMLTKSRTSLILDVLLILLIYYGGNEGGLLDKVTKKYMKYIFTIISVLIYFAQTNYMSGNSMIRIVDMLLTGRLKYAAYAYERSGLTWLPRYLDYANEGVVSWTPYWKLNTFAFDCIYSFGFMQMGILWLLIITVIIAIMSKITNYKCRLFVLLWIIFSITEVHGINCFKFFPILLLSYLLSVKETTEDTTII